MQTIASERMVVRLVSTGLQAVIVNPSMCVGDFDTKPSTGEFLSFSRIFPCVDASEGMDTAKQRGYLHGATVAVQDVDRVHEACIKKLIDRQRYAILTLDLLPPVEAMRVTSDAPRTRVADPWGRYFRDAAEACSVVHVPCAPLVLPPAE
jgi:hypothetical protein